MNHGHLQIYRQPVTIREPLFIAYLLSSLSVYGFESLDHLLPTETTVYLLL